MSREYDMECLRVLCEGMLSTIEKCKQYKLDTWTRTHIHALACAVQLVMSNLWADSENDKPIAGESDK